MSIAFALLFVLLLLLCWTLTVAGLPGNWLIVAFTAAYAYLTSGHATAAIGWQTVIAILVLAVLGEVVETVAGALGAAKAGGSKRGALLTLAGSLVGSLLGLVLSTPIPIVGTIIASVFLAGVGAMTGAVLGETWAGRQLDATWQIAKLAFWGRLAGALGKILLGAVMLAVVVLALVL